MARSRVPVTSDTATYVYGVAAGRSAPRLVRAPAGLPGMGRPRVVRVAAGLWLVVADAPLVRWSAARIESGLRDLDWVSRCALAHEAMVEHVVRGGATVVPMKMFTLFADDARAIAHVTRLRRKLDALLRRVAGRQEWGLRVTLDERRALARATTGGDGASASGTAFLLRKKAEKDAAQRLAAEARVEADRLFDDLAGRADDARRRRPDAGTPGRLLLEAAFLVPVARARAFRAEIARRARALAPDGYDLNLSGPWPPYSFVTDAS
ncbi:MAG TPA: GvpL/GvpF family gas vesicle protein [Candidatus Acidoferrum sp.]|nr:GvpL/GvpF family gas vesicle protein [Candidatus Acidoferrum sp.]